MSGGDADAGVASGKAEPARLVRALPHLVMLAAAVFLYWAANQIDAYTGGGARIGPDAWPKAILVFMGLLCAFEAGRRLLGRGPGPAPVRGQVGSESHAPGPMAEPDAGLPAPAAGLAAAQPEPTQDHPRMLAGGIALVAGYVVLVPWLGFFVTTAVFLALFPWIGGLRRPLLAASLGVVGSFLLVVLFMRVAYISLPLGAGPFRSLSLGLLQWIGVI